MDTSFLYLFDVIILLYSAFLLMWWVRVKFRGETFPAKLLLPQDLLLEECRDIPGYNRFVAPRVLCFALLLLLIGGSSLLLGPEKLGAAFFAVYAGFFVLVVLLYMDTGKKARKFW